MRKKKSTHMKRKKLTSIAFASAIFAPSTLSAVTVFTQTFDGAIVAAAGANLGGFGTQVFDGQLPQITDAAGVTTPGPVQDLVFSGNNNTRVNGIQTDNGTGTVNAGSAGELQLLNITNSRGLTFFVDLSTFAAGAYEANFDITAFTGTRPAAQIYSSISLVSGVSTGNGVSFDLSGPAGGLAPGVGPSLAPNGASTATVNFLGETLFTPTTGSNNDGTGLTSLGAFNLPTDGAAGDFLAVSVIRDGAAGAGTSSSITIDTFTIDSVPEPSSLLLLGLGSFAFLARRR